MAKLLTAAAVARRKPDKQKRLEIPDGGCKGLHLIIQKSGVKSWAFRFRRPRGKSAKLTLGPVDLSGKEADGDPEIGTPLTLSAARALAAEVERRRKRGHDPAAEHMTRQEEAKVVAAERAAKTFAAAARQFIDEHTVRRSGQKPRHWREVARILGLSYPPDGKGGDPEEVKGSLAERWREKPIAEIDGHDVYTIIDEARRYGIPGLKARNEDVSDNRGRKMADALSTMFGWLLQHRRIATDPTVGVWRPPPPAARDRVLNSKPDVRRADELRWFWSACDSVGEPFGGLFRLLLLTGCRRDEIGEMRWDELSDDFSMLRLPGERTKNGRQHTVPLPPLARDILRKVKRKEGSWVFSISGKRPAGTFAKAKERLDEAMLGEARKERGENAEIEPFVLHDLRRTCATGMAGIGIAPHVIEACLNHVSGAKAGVAGVYNVEQYEPEKRAALERWAEHVERIVAGQTAKVVAMRKPGA